MKIIEWLKRVFHISKPVEVEEVRISARADITEVKDPAQSKPQAIDDTKEVRKKIETLKREALELARGSKGIAKQLKIERIRKKNRERQRSTLGYGLKGKFFKPRPAFEKRTWRLDEKAEDD